MAIFTLMTMSKTKRFGLTQNWNKFRQILEEGCFGRIRIGHTDTRYKKWLTGSKTGVSNKRPAPA